MCFVLKGFHIEMATIPFGIFSRFNSLIKAEEVAPSETKGYNSYTNSSYYDMFL